MTNNHRKDPVSHTCRCGQPVNGTTLCNRCRRTVEVALANIPAYYADAEVTLTRRQAVRYDLPRGKGGSKAMPLPVDQRFLPKGAGTQAVHQVRNAVVTWVRVLLDECPPPQLRPLCDDALCKRCSRIRHETALRRPPRDTVASCCAYLLRMLPRIASAPWAEECKRDLLDAERALHRVDARGPERIYAGLCTICLAVREHSALYALPGDEWVKCPADDCGMEYRVAERRALMEDALEFEWFTASKIADLSAYLRLVGDREWVRKKLNRWHSEGVLKPASVTPDGVPVFPFGEARRLLLEADARRQQRARLARKGA